MPVGQQDPPYFRDLGRPQAGLAAFNFDTIGRPTYESHFDGSFTATEYDGLNTRRLRRVLRQSNP